MNTLLRSLIACLAVTGTLCTALSAVAAPRHAKPLGPPVSLAAFARLERLARLPDGITMGYVDMGPRNGQPVVLIHGFTNDAFNWLPLIPYLDPHLRLILVDLRGHGESSKPACCYARIDMAYDVLLLMNRLGIAKADLIGHSLGSIIAQTFAETWPKRVGRVVLISSTGGYRSGCTAGPPTDAPPLPELRAALLKMHDPINPNGRFMSAWYGNARPPDPNLLKRQKRDAAAIPVKIWLAVLDQAVTGIDLQTTLPRLTAPALLIWGAKDTLMGPADRCSLERALPHAQVKIFANAGHNPFWKEPAAVAAVINPFLDKTAP
ncbi:MAG: alpha/beta fold hydrolase [Steroidobacteraceae bacterium]|nr:alpha/beta fold hydrolase [Steroidobacteraceae bacterium]